MACGCSKDKAEAPVVSPERKYELGTSAPKDAYVVMPDEACLMCAGKHASSAYAEARTTARTMSMLGDLELARRHLQRAYDRYAERSAAIMAKIVVGVDGWRPCLGELAAELLQAAENDEKAAVPVAKSGVQDVGNVLVGLVRLAAARRLAEELGYMPKNRAMIIGDLVAAAEQLVRADSSLAMTLRELRHRVHTSPRADLSMLWQMACDRAETVVGGRSKDGVAELLPGLYAYLGLPSDFIPEV